MKRIYLVLSICFLAFSCQDIETSNLGMETQWLQFESDELSVGEDAPEALAVPVLFSANSNESGVDVSFSYTASAMTGFTVSPANGVVNIPAGEFVGYIYVTPENDDISGEGIVLDFTIDNTDLPLGIAGQGIYNMTSQVTIIDDDCPIDLSEWAGTYSVSEIFTAGTNEGLTLAGAFGESYQLEISADPSDTTGTKVIINNSIGFNTYFLDGTVMTFLTCLQEVNFDAGNPNLALFADMVIETSVFSGDSFSIKCNGELTSYGPYEFVLTKI